MTNRDQRELTNEMTNEMTGVRTNHNDKLKQYLKTKIEELEKQIKTSKHKYLLVKITYGSLLIISVSTATVICVITPMGIPALVISIISSVTAVSTAFTTKFNLKSRKNKLNESIKKLHILKDKLEYVLMCNGDLTDDECQRLFEEFRKI